MASNPMQWWGTFKVPLNAGAYWHIGPLELWARRAEGEWRFAHRHGDDPLETTLVVECPTEREEPAGIEDRRRFGFRASTDRISLIPVAAPRPVIVSPDVPFSLPPKQETILFVSSPLWVEVKTERPETVLLEIPTYRPSDTWFGDSTRVGELCFASRTRARQQLSDVEIFPHRVISAIHIRNRADEMLGLERIKLPTPNLSVYADDSGQTWTEQVNLDHESEQGFAQLSLGRGARDGVKTQLLRRPREKAEKGLSIRSFGEIFR